MVSVTRLVGHRAIRLPALCLILGAEIVAMRAVVSVLPPVFYLPFVPKARTDWAAPTGYDADLDPCVGDPLPAAPGATYPDGENESPWSAGAPAAILVIGSCSSCGSDVARPWATLCSRVGVPLYLVTSDHPDRVDEFLQAEMIECVPVLDRDLALSRRLNAAWTPRAYLVAADGRFAFVQPPAMPDDEALREAADTLKSWQETGGR